MGMLRPQPHEPPPGAIQDRRRVEDLRRLLNRSESAMRQLTKERDLARWQLVLQRNETARLAAENEYLRAQLQTLAGGKRVLGGLRARSASKQFGLNGPLS